ncbi:hypothetical protein EYF80_043508 [Liparis tanakae]|uniref:Uncharacterized protein n=1 Tax=Liparis tanakae TaxID=230148 RepID=A0A4Z2FZG0_9TELE|nr:hypothetical protein EYF80_043508 [Liparis tanakae]
MSEERSGTACRRRLVRETFVNVSVLRDFPSSFSLMSCKTQQSKQRTSRHVLWVLTSEGVAATMELLRGRGRGVTKGSGDLPQALPVVHQGPVHALLRPVWLQQAAQHRHVEVGGVARSLGQGGRQAGGGRCP